LVRFSLYGDVYSQFLSRDLILYRFEFDRVCISVIQLCCLCALTQQFSIISLL